MAAQELHITQAAMTRRIQSLEKDLQVTLFLRSRKGVSLTPEGRELLKYCRQSQELEGEVLSRMGQGKDLAKQRITLMAHSSFMRARIIPSVSQVLKSHPATFMTFKVDDFNESLEAIKKGKVDLGVMPHQFVVNEFDSKVLKPETYVLVVCNDWKDRPIDEILRSETMIDFDERDTLTFDLLEKHGFQVPSKERHFVNNTDGLASMIAAGVGYSVLSLEYIKICLPTSQLCVHSDLEMELPMALAWYPRSFMSASFQEIVKTIS